VELDAVKEALLDEVLADYAGRLGQDPAEQNSAVTLVYTHGVHRLWRSVLRMLPIAADWSVLDVGCGLGILCFELAANLPVTVEGVDIEPAFVGHANQLRARLGQRGLLAAGSAVRFTEGDIGNLAGPDDSVDLVFVRELLQFLPDPVAALGEVKRVLKPGGYACVSDTDDQLYLTWPPASEAQTRLVEAVTQLHRQRGGDRHTGRKLSTHLAGAGFEVDSIVVLPEAQHRTVDAEDRERVVILEQLRAARGRVVEAGVMTAADFDADLAELEGQPGRVEFRMNASIVVLGRKPPA